MPKVELTIKNLRKESGITQNDLAKALGVTFQTVSKWENGSSYPDIALLPELAEYFKVSVDQILGLSRAYDKNYVVKGSDKTEYWSNKQDYINATRRFFWNDDYFQFIFTRVLNINKQVDIIDFGCGTGYLGGKLMSFLPQGSHYTGVDFSREFLDQLEDDLEKHRDSIKVIESDINTYIPDKKHDIAICQALLRHTSNPHEIISKMIQSVKPGGLVICIEVNRPFEALGTMLESLEYEPLQDIAPYSKLWKSELDNEGRDFSIGLKLPFLLEEAGLERVDIRLNDKVEFYSKNNKKLGVDMKKYCDLKGWKKLSIEEEHTLMSFLENRGYTPGEVQDFIETKSRIAKHIGALKKVESLVSLTGTLISYGYKPTY
tara:strand:- start:745 stop:1869 length:1125 start_codon:yes stop_codon:yes gene_type:complete